MRIIKKLAATLAVALTMVSCGSESPRFRVLSCGIRHESNTFSTIPVTLDDFTVWRGQEVLDEHQPWSEYLLSQKDVELIPTTHAYAWPGGIVAREVYETVKGEILEGIHKAGHLDGIYMDMHGALHVDGYDDAQADLIAAIRELVGDEVVISASFDLHGNVSDEFASGLNLMTAFRTAPHRDGAETKLRAVKNLMRVLREGLKPKMAHVEIPILVPGEKSITEVEPLHSIYARLDSIERSDGIQDASILVGYAWADLPRSAMRTFVVAEDEEHLDKASGIASDLASEIWNARGRMELDVESGPIDKMIARAYELPESTVFISDSGDNTTAGAPGDNPQVIKALLDAGAENALFAGLVDKDAFDKCVAAGEGSLLGLTMGGVKDNIFGFPIDVEAKVLKVTQDAVLIQTDSLKIALLDKRNSFTTVGQFTDLGLDPLSFKVVVVKLGYLYPELRDIAPVHLMALTSGFCNLDMRSLPFHKVRRPVYPLDSEMDWIPDK